MLLRNITLELNNMEAETCGIHSCLAKPQSQAVQRAELRYWISDREYDGTHLVPSEWSLPSTWAVSFLRYTHNSQVCLVQETFPRPKIIPESMLLSSPQPALFRLLTTRYTHLPYKGLKPAHVAVHSYNSRSKVYHGNREVALRATSAPVKKSKPWKRSSESFPGQTQLFFIPEKQLF